VAGSAWIKRVDRRPRSIAEERVKPSRAPCRARAARL